jgi:hypothetical protein
MNVRDADGRSENPAPFKRRSFLATRQDEALETEALRIRTQLGDAFPDKIPDGEKDDDLPVLTEVIPADGEDHETKDARETPPASPAGHRIDPEELAKQMAEAIERQLAYELPTLIEASLLNISADLCSGIASTMQTALKDFVARHKQR